MGDTQALERYIPAIKNAEGATAKMAATQKAMADAFAIAEESSGSSSVQLEALKGRIGDLGQAIVSAATGGEGFGEGLRKIADWVKDITPKVAKFVSILRILGTSVVMRIRIGFRNLGAVFSKFGSFIGGGTKGIEGFVQAINFAINRISKWGAILSDVLTGEWDKIEEDAKAFDDQLRTSTDEITELFKDKVKVEVDTPEGKPIKLLGVGEKMDALEDFYPKRIADRILGMGDIVSLVEKAAQTIDAEQAEAMAKKMQKGLFDMDDLSQQLGQMSQMGGMGSIMKMMPGIGKMAKQIEAAGLDDNTLALGCGHGVGQQ